MSRNRVIGRDNRLPWHLPDELAYFFRVTRGHHVIMGRKNFEANGKALPGRTNVVITRQDNFTAPGCITVHSIPEAIAYATTHNEKEMFIIGGGEIYQQTLPLADRIYLTIIETELEGDAYYPEVDFDNWCVVSSTFHPADERHAFGYTISLLESPALQKP